MGNLPLATIPHRLDLQQFTNIVTEHGPMRTGKAGDGYTGGSGSGNPFLDCSTIFEGLRSPDGYVYRDTLLEFAKATDVYISHEWGYDEDGRSVHDRVRFVNKAMKKAGLVTWFDEDQEKVRVCVCVCACTWDHSHFLATRRARAPSI